MLLTLVAVSAPARGKRESPAPSPKTGSVVLPADHALFQKLAAAGFEVPTSEIMSTDFTLDQLGAGPAKLSSWRGSLVLLNFWATWCPPCREEIPSMEKLYTTLKNKGFVVLAVDLAEQKEVVKSFVTANKMTYPVLLDASGDVGTLYGARSIPTTYVIDRSGRILGRVIGARDWVSKETIALFESLLAN